MTQDALIFKTNDKPAIDWWLGKKAEIEAYVVAAAEWKARVLPSFPKLATERQVFTDRTGIVGVAWDSGDHASDIPSGWRLHSKRKNMYIPVPNKDSGVRALLDMTSFRLPTAQDANLVGVPPYLHLKVTNVSINPGFEFVDETLYVLFTDVSYRDVDFVERQMESLKVEGVAWARVQLDEWQADLEAWRIKQATPTVEVEEVPVEAPEVIEDVTPATE